MTFENVQFVRAIDGDTIVINIPGQAAVFGHLISVRLAGIQCEELKSTDKEKKHKAIVAKQFTNRLCEAATKISLYNCKRGKYFRLVADVSVDNLLLSTELLREGLAVQKRF